MDFSAIVLIFITIIFLYFTRRPINFNVLLCVSYLTVSFCVSFSRSLSGSSGSWLATQQRKLVERREAGRRLDRGRNEARVMTELRSRIGQVRLGRVGQARIVRAGEAGLGREGEAGQCKWGRAGKAGHGRWGLARLERLDWSGKVKLGKGDEAGQCKWGWAGLVKQDTSPVMCWSRVRDYMYSPVT